MESELFVEESGSSLGGGSEKVVDGFRLRGIVGVVLKGMLPVRLSKLSAASSTSFTIVMAWESVAEATTGDK